MLTPNDLIFFFAELNRMFPITKEPSGKHNMELVEGVLVVNLFLTDQWATFSTDIEEWDDLPKLLADIAEIVDPSKPLGFEDVEDEGHVEDES
jgi:hypothetical protein